MSRSRHAVGVLLVSVFGLWGCSRALSADGSTATAEKLKAVETKLARRKTTSGRRPDRPRPVGQAADRRRGGRMALQAQTDRLNKELKARDEQGAARTAERDQAAGHSRPPRTSCGSC